MKQAKNVRFWFSYILILIIKEVVPAIFDAQPQADNNDDKGSSKATTCKAQLVEEELIAGKLPAQPAIVVVVVVVVV